MLKREQRKIKETTEKGAEIDEEKLWHFAIVRFVSFWEMTQKVENSFKRLEESLAPDITRKPTVFTSYPLCEMSAREFSLERVWFCMRQTMKKFARKRSLKATMKNFSLIEKAPNAVGRAVTTRVYNMLSQHKSRHCERNRN